MKLLLDLCPAAPRWSLDWDTIDATFEWVHALRGVPQDPEWHAEGEVWLHVRMVTEALVGSESWRTLCEVERHVLFAAALLHDVAKPETTRTEEDGRITARHHSARGAVRARRILFELGAPPRERELVAQLVLQHQRPLHAIERCDAERLATRSSWTCGMRRVIELARADVLGRTCSDRQRLLDNIALFEELGRELDCLDAPRVFPSSAHRVHYFADEGRAFDAPAAPAARCEVVVLSGLPGAGKDTWLASRGLALPVIAPDTVRRELGIRPTDEQGLVVQTCRERAREHLRAGRSFAWNATNLSRLVRGKVLDLCHAYGAHTRVIAVEVAAADWRQRNRDRTAGVPEAALERMLDRWEAPDLTESHHLEVIESERSS